MFLELRYIFFKVSIVMSFGKKYIRLILELHMVHERVCSMHLNQFIYKFYKLPSIEHIKKNMCSDVLALVLGKVCNA